MKVLKCSFPPFCFTNPESDSQEAGGGGIIAPLADYLSGRSPSLEPFCHRSQVTGATQSNSDLWGNDGREEAKWRTDFFFFLRRQANFCKCPTETIEEGGKIDKFSSWDLRQTNKAAAGSCKTTAAEATLGASTWHWIEHFIGFIENSAAAWRRFLTRLSILWRLCVSQSISWLVSVSANLRRSHVQPNQLGTYLHANLIEHQASRVVEETVSLPAELHGVLVHLVQHWEKKKTTKKTGTKRMRSRKSGANFSTCVSAGCV